MTRSTQELIATAEAHLDASDQSQFSQANGVELLNALKREHATVAALRKALEGLDEVLDFDGECEGTQIIERHAVPELRAAMLAARAALALRDPAGKET